MGEYSTLKLHKRDNVVVLTEGGHPSIPVGHKIAVKPIVSGDAVIKYGYSIGVATSDIRTGDWVHDHNVETGLSGTLQYAYKPENSDVDAIDDGLMFEGYQREDGQVGIRNEIWIIPTVGCVNGLAEKAASKLRSEGLPGNIEDVVVFSHPYGCSQLGHDHESSKRILASLVNHPNAGGVLIVGLGCENNTMSAFKELLGPINEKRVKCLVTQEVEDEQAECSSLLASLRDYASSHRRTSIPISKLRVGLKCGGSDAFSGVTANPLVGAFSDALIARGGSTVLTEIPEVFGAETILFDRCVNEETFDKAVDLVNGFKNYFISHGEPVGENPSPGNKDGGISTLEDKSLGCVQKGGRAPLVDVLRYGDRLKLDGLTLLEGPGNDIVAVTALAASGCHMVLFTTGRGTPLGGAVPVVKIASNSQLAARKKNWIDFDAGVLLRGVDMDDLTQDFLQEIVKTASGKSTCNERNGYRDFSIWKRGVTL